MDYYNLFHSNAQLECYVFQTESICKEVIQILINYGEIIHPFGLRGLRFKEGYESILKSKNISYQKISKEDARRIARAEAGDVFKRLEILIQEALKKPK